MSDWLRKSLQSAFYLGLEMMLVRSARTRQMLMKMALGVFAFAGAAVLGLLAFIIFLGGLFFYLADQTKFVAPALWSGLLVVLITCILAVWGNYFWRVKQIKD